MKIKQLKIWSPNLEKQSQFYRKVLGLTILEKTDKFINFQIGSSILKIEERENATPYHFAINIPSNQEKEAHQWLKERVIILKDEQYEIQDFDFWNAKAIYFYDADNNIIEFIARKNLGINSDQKFSINSLIEISEIGIPVNEIEKTYNQLSEIVNIPVFDGNFERFCAIGDEHGLFIAINKNVKDWFPVNDKAYSSDFEIDFIQKENHYSLKFENQQFL